MVFVDLSKENDNHRLEEIGRKLEEFTNSLEENIAELSEEENELIARVKRLQESEQRDLLIRCVGGE